ncbi:Clathrin/coatomer adaptor, adaptin-like protein [Entophlyctis helioformis]|nr:Clathrin/coatomer adaptor, adaptin-like protein [Entophlyctis helioformis]
MIPKLGITRLKDLIKAIRACKTAADERAVIAKESASIRTAFKEESNETRYINIAKLLYIHMLGYPAHFGQIECLKLVASPRFADKRLAYLGIMLLLDENQETLTLVTNCLKNDLNSSNMYTVGLALCTLGNIASQEMSRDLSGEIERLLGSTNSYLRKKAALCAVRIIRKVPDLLENFLERAQALLNERNHGVLLTGVTLLIEMCLISPQVTAVIRESVPLLVRHLKSLVTAGSSPEHDVNGITDPFLQVKILRLLRVLGKGDARASEAMNDVLAQVATTTESSKNVGNAILYEAVLTIMDIESESSLRVLGINILGRFLSNRDNNIKYVALTTLTKTSQMATITDTSALQRHRATVLDCLRDPDISIRRRALDLSFYLITPTNIRILTRELLSFLEIAEGEIKSSVASRICDYVGRYRPNKRWEIDTVTRVLRVAGAYVDQNVVNHFVKLVSTGDSAVHQYAVRKLYNIIKTEGELAHMQEGLLQAAFWSVGEYGDVLVSASTSALGFGVEEDEQSGATSDSLAAPGEQEVVDLYVTILRGPYATNYVKEYAVTSLVKLCSRFTQSHVIECLKTIIAKYRTSIDVEIQQRAVEFTQILALDRETRIALLEPMPVLESAVAEEALKGTGAAPAGSSPTSARAASNTADLLGNDLAGLALGGAGGAASTSNVLDSMFGGSAVGAGAARGSTKSEVRC